MTTLFQQSSLGTNWMVIYKVYQMLFNKKLNPYIYVFR